MQIQGVAIATPGVQNVRGRSRAEIKADMAAQLARVREMERNGELEPIPEVSAAVHRGPPPSGNSPTGVR